MKLSVESIQQSLSEEVVSGDLDTVLAEQYSDINETLLDLESMFNSLDQLDDIENNLEALQSTVENAGVSEDILKFANSDEQICTLLEIDELPEVTERNKDQLAENLTAACEAEKNGVWESIKKFFQKIWETIKGLVQKAMDFVTSMEKKLKKESERIKGLSPKDEAFENTVKVIRSVKVKFKDYETTIEGSWSEIMNSTSETLTKINDILGDMLKKGLGEVDTKDLDDTKFEASEKQDISVKEAGIANKDELLTTIGEAQKLYDLIKNVKRLNKAFGSALKDLEKSMKKDGSKEKANEAKKAGKAAMKGIKGMVSISMKILKDTLSLSRAVK